MVKDDYENYKTGCNLEYLSSIGGTYVDNLNFLLLEHGLLNYYFLFPRMEESQTNINIF